MSSAVPSSLDAVAFPNKTAARLAHGVPSAGLVPVLYELRPSMLSVDGRIDALLAVERHIAMLQARSMELLAALDLGDTTDDKFIRDEVAAALRLPPASMKERMLCARELVERLPVALELLRAGEISQRHAAHLLDATGSLTADTATTIEAAVLNRAPLQTATQFRVSVAREVTRVASPAEEDAAHADAVIDRRVIFLPDAAGMTEMRAYLRADSAALIKATLDAMAHKTIHLLGGDQRTADQRRADALVDLARTTVFPTDPAPTDPAHTDPAPTDPAPTDPAHTDPAHTDPAHTVPTDTDLVGSDCSDPARTGPGWAKGHGERPAIQVTIAASTLMGLDDQPGDLDGYGPITAAMARRIAADTTATWRRLLTDDRGHVLHASTTGYRPTAAMVATVLARDQHCTFPGCRRAARYNDIDHVKAWRKGDRTTPANLTSLCRRHHRLKHSGRWRVRRDDASGVMTWTNRRGRTYRNRPPTRATTTTGIDPVFSRDGSATTGAAAVSNATARPITVIPELPPF